MAAVEDASNPFRPVLTVHPRAQQAGLVLLLHGAGASARDMRGLAERWAWGLPHVKFVMPSAPVWPGERSQAQCFWFGRDTASGEPAGLREPWLELLRLIELERIRQAVPISRVVLAGFSMGSSMASWTALQLPHACAGLILLSGGIMGHNSVTQAAKRTPVMYCTGGKDTVVEVAATRQCRDVLRSLGLQVSYFEYPDLDHSTSEEELDFIQGWLKTVLPQQPADPCEAQACSLSAEIRRLGGVPPTEFRISAGTRVTVRRLVAAPEHNGCEGRVCSFDATRVRFTVDMGQGRRLALRPANFAQRLHVKLLGVRREGALAGCLQSEAEIVDVDEGPDGGVEAYALVLVGTEREVRLAPDKVLLPSGSVLRLVGLTSERGRAVVGRFCCIGTFQGGRYTVDVEGESKPMNVKPCNLCP